jgi:hypothetical protein
MDIIFSGKKLDKKEVREYDPKLSDYNMACSMEAADFETETSTFMYSEPAEVVPEPQADYQAPVSQSRMDAELAVKDQFVDILRMAEKI